MDGEIDPDDLAALLDGTETGSLDGTETGAGDDRDGERVTVVDIRTAGEFSRGRIPDSRNLPFAELPARVGELDGADRIVTVCPHGIASKQAADLIASYEGTASARVESLRGGIEAWDGPLERDDPGTDPGDDGPDAPF